jgi:hypothetical protein
MGTDADGFGARGCMWPDERGLYVLSEDYDLKSAECERLRSALAFLRDRCDGQNADPAISCHRGFIQNVLAPPSQETQQ